MVATVAVRTSSLTPLTGWLQSPEAQRATFSVLILGGRKPAWGRFTIQDTRLIIDGSTSMRGPFGTVTAEGDARDQEINMADHSTAAK